MGYVLTTKAMRVVNKNERGAVTYRKRYKKGDEVDTSKLEEGRLEALVESGALAEAGSEAEVDDALASAARSQAAQVSAGSSGPSDSSGDRTEPVSDEQHEDAIKSAEDEDGEEEDEDFASKDDTPDSYDSMGFEQLKAEAGSRGLGKNGSAEDIKRRLRKDDDEE